jgi:release factor glutamine methyltransferase
MTIGEALKWAKNILREKGVEGPENSAEFLLRQVLHKDKPYLFAHPEHNLTLIQKTKYRSWIVQRSKHKPVWYIAGKIEFLGLDILVNQNVLIPRPETELLVEKIIEEVRGGFVPKSILDIGTGSGAIVLSLVDNLEHFGGEKFFASDISREALVVAKRNAKSLGFDKNIEFKKGDLFEPWNGKKFDLIVTNLPYIPHEDMPTLALDLIHYEPRTALDGGHLGLEIYERFFHEVGEHLNKGAKVFCEIGYDQGEKITKLLSKFLPQSSVRVIGDYADIDRIVTIET